MVAIDYMGVGLVSCREKFFDIGVIYANGARDMGPLVRIWVTDVDEDSLPISASVTEMVCIVESVMVTSPQKDQKGSVSPQLLGHSSEEPHPTPGHIRVVA